MFKAREVEISADRPFTLYADGDPVCALPVRVRALSGAVRVLVPAQRAAERVALPGGGRRASGPFGAQAADTSAPAAQPAVGSAAAPDAPPSAR